MTVIILVHVKTSVHAANCQNCMQKERSERSAVDASTRWGVPSTYMSMSMYMCMHMSMYYA